MGQSKKVIVIGSGFSGLAAACCLAQQNVSVVVLEKNQTPGGRARRLREKGYSFDMGPSWYWMPDVFERFFEKFGRSVGEFYQLRRLDPSYQVFFGDGQSLDVPADYKSLQTLFESLEPGSGDKLVQFMDQAKVKYETGMHHFVYKPAKSVSEFINHKSLLKMLELDLFQSFHQHVRKFFKHPKILQILTFPVLFLGAPPEKTPALYSLMNYADMQLGTWYPAGGMHKIVKSMVNLAHSLGVEIICDQEVKKIVINSGRATQVKTNTHLFDASFVVSSADYQFIETNCIIPKYRSYSKTYWDRRTMSPSCLIYFLGINKTIKGLRHHNLFFDESLSDHTNQIYENPQWPSKPLFYVSATSKSDPMVCPPGHENLFVLIPVATGLKDTEEVRAIYLDLVMDRMENKLGESIRDSVNYLKCYSHRNFIRDYHAFKGNAYGLANTLRQTAFMKPKLKSKKVENLYYTGHLTVPGPGVPPSLISGQIVANEILKTIFK